MRAAALLLAFVALHPAVTGARVGAVASEHPLAATAGAEVLRAGGTVVDAAIAAATTACVVHPASCGIGGGGFALVRLADGSVAALDYREVAPAGLTRDRLRVDGKPSDALLRTGGLAVGVPGDVAGIAELHRRFGRLALGQDLAPAIRLARDGFRLGDAPHLRGEIERARALLAGDPGLAHTFLAPDGAVPDAEFRVLQPDLAATLETIAARGTAAFYRGPIADGIAATVATRHGVLTVADLARYRPRWRGPLRGRFRGRSVITFPPPGSGGVLLEMLGVLARDDLAALDGGSATYLHLVAGAMAQGFADRARWYGDPAFTTVPLHALLAPPRLAALRAELSAIRVSEPHALVLPESGTTHVSVVDADGNAAAITTTINTSFGAGVLVPGTGIILNNELDDFAVAPEVKNVFGLTGGTANAVGPGKRPQSSMSPTIVLAGRRPALVVGGSGGPTIISGVLQVVLRAIALGQPLGDAVDAPRIHDQAAPPALAIEAGIDPTSRAALERLGHRLSVVPRIGTVSAVGLGADRLPSAAGDARKDGGAVVVR